MSEISAPELEQLTPKQIVAELDRHIIGQDDAKRAVAIALRNRWRRMQLAEELREEVSPKNILMIGPTGVGKTEIARRLARLAKAPFIKIEATKFTAVNLVASILMNGALASLAKRRAISVLPTPVGPIIKIFLGLTSSRNSSANCMRRQRFRNAMATARFASSWPMICRSSSATICFGVSCSSSGAEISDIVLFR